MAKKKASGGPEPGTPLKVREGVQSPDFPEVSFAGWTGTVVEVSGKAPDVKIVLEWDAQTMAQMPAEYVSRCEAQQLYYSMACLPLTNVDLGPSA